MGNMILPDRVVAIARAIRALHITLALGTEDDRRALTKLMAEQVCFELGPQWGTKAGGKGRPASKDALAFLSATGTLWGWDSLNGETREVSDERGMEDITGQEFIAVVPVNHLGSAGAPVVGPSPVEPAPPVLGPSGPSLEDIRAELVTVQANLLKGVASLTGQLYDQAERIYADMRQRVASAPAPVFVPPVYEGSFTLFGRTVTFALHPRKQ